MSLFEDRFRAMSSKGTTVHSLSRSRNKSVEGIVGGGPRAHFPAQRLAILCLLTEGPFALTMEITRMQPLAKLPTLPAIKYRPGHVEI